MNRWTWHHTAMAAALVAALAFTVWVAADPPRWTTRGRLLDLERRVDALERGR